MHPALVVLCASVVCLLIAVIPGGAFAWGISSMVFQKEGQCFVRFGNDTRILWSFARGGNLTVACHEMDHCVKKWVGWRADEVCNFVGTNIETDYVGCKCWVDERAQLDIRFGGRPREGPEVAIFLGGLALLIDLAASIGCTIALILDHYRCYDRQDSQVSDEDSETEQETEESDLSGNI